MIPSDGISSLVIRMQPLGKYAHVSRLDPFPSKKSEKRLQVSGKQIPVPQAISASPRISSRRQSPSVRPSPRTVRRSVAWAEEVEKRDFEREDLAVRRHRDHASPTVVAQPQRFRCRAQLFNHVESLGSVSCSHTGQWRGNLFIQSCRLGTPLNRFASRSAESPQSSEPWRPASRGSLDRRQGRWMGTARDPKQAQAQQPAASRLQWRGGTKSSV